MLYALWNVVNLLFHLEMIAKILCKVHHISKKKLGSKPMNLVLKLHYFYFLFILVFIRSEKHWHVL